MKKAFRSYTCFSLLLLVLSLNACKPRDILDRDELCDVLLDIHMTDAALKSHGDSVPVEWTKGLDNKTFKDLAYQSVLRKHNLTQSDFDRTIAWYSNHMNQYDMVYTRLEKRLQALLAELDRGGVNYDQQLLGLGLKPEYVENIYKFGLFRPDSALTKSLMMRNAHEQQKRIAAQWLYPGTVLSGVSPLLTSELKPSEASAVIQRPDSQVVVTTNSAVPSSQGVNTGTPVENAPARGTIPMTNEEIIRSRVVRNGVPTSNLSPEERRRRLLIEASRKQTEQNHWKN